MRAVLIALGRALLSQLHLRMLMLTFWPFLLSVVIWGAVLWFALQPMIDWVQAYFAANDGFAVAGSVLGWFGLDAIKVVLVPLIAMWALLPLMIVTALVFVGVLAMPAIIRHVASRHYPDLELRHGGSLWGSAWIALSSFVIFLVLWIVTLPFTAIPPFTFLIPPALWGWLTYRVMAYDALAEHASEQERRHLLRAHRWPLFLMGAVAGTMGTAPSFFWMGGVFSVIFFPLLAAISIWLFVLIFVFTGLWFQFYCLEALAGYRTANRKPIVVDSSQLLSGS